jgi:hypothetical protein
MPDQHSPQERRWTLTRREKALGFRTEIDGPYIGASVEVMPVAEHLAALQDREAELGQMLKVSEEHTQHWEARANRAEAALREAREELERLAATERVAAEAGGIPNAIEAHRAAQSAYENASALLGTCERCEGRRFLTALSGPPSMPHTMGTPYPCPACQPLTAPALDTSIGDREPEAPVCISHAHRYQNGVKVPCEYCKPPTPKCACHFVPDEHKCADCTFKPPAPCSDRASTQGGDASAVGPADVGRTSTRVTGGGPAPDGGSAPETSHERAVKTVVDFLDAWRHCPVSTASTPSHSCLEDAATQLVDALHAAPTQPPVPVPREARQVASEDADASKGLKSCVEEGSEDWPAVVYAKRAPDWVVPPRLSLYSPAATNEPDLESRRYIPAPDSPDQGGDGR